MPKESLATMQAIAIYMTIPASILTSLGSFTKDPKLIICTVFFAILFLSSLFITYFLNRKKPELDCAYAMLTTSGYNLGSMAFPVVQNFYGPYGVLISGMADIFNCIMVNGGLYAVTTAILRKESENIGQFFKNIIRRLLSSPPFVSYLMLIPIVLFDFAIPKQVIEFLSPIASANSLACMGMVGLSLGETLTMKELKEIWPELSFRLIFGWVTAIIAYTLLPVSGEMREVLTILCVSPISSLASYNSSKYGADGEKAGLFTTVSMLISMGQMILLASIFQII